MDSLTCAKSAFMTDIESLHQGIITYNKLYSNYKNNNCTISSSDDIKFTITGLNRTDFSGNDFPNNYQVSPINCSKLYTNIIDNGTQINNARQNIQRSINLDGEKYLNNANILNNEYSKVTHKRNLLDTQMQEILGYQNSMRNEKQSIIDSAVYTTLLWTVLTTSILYYTFTKL
jgi:hypothetical protein